MMNAVSTAVTGLGHVVLYVRNLERSVAFYRDVVGWSQVIKPEPGFRAAGFSGGSTHHELLLIEVGSDAEAIPTGRRVGMYHFGIKVGDHDDDLRAALARLQARPDLVSIVGASDHTITHSLYVLDPDGNEVEIYIDVPGVDWRNDPAVLTATIKPLYL